MSSAVTNNKPCRYTKRAAVHTHSGSCSFSFFYFAVQAGREVRIMVKPDVISDDQVILLARSIAKKIEDTLDYPGQIKVNVIRESRAVEYAK